MGDRIGPVGTGEAGQTAVASGSSGRCPVNWNMSLDRQEALVSFIMHFPLKIKINANIIVRLTILTFHRMQWITQQKVTWTPCT